MVNINIPVVGWHGNIDSIDSGDDSDVVIQAVWDRSTQLHTRRTS